MHVLRIVLLCMAAAVAYGILHDNVTARVCVEYFTIGHNPPIPTTSPTVLAFMYGVLATWWFGLMLGLPLAVCSRLGGMPKLGWREQIRPLLCLFAVAAVFSLVAGVAGYFLARSGQITLGEPLATRVPREKHVVFLADGAAHLAAYGTGFVGAIVLCMLTLSRRYYRFVAEHRARKLTPRLKSC